MAKHSLSYADTYNFVKKKQGILRSLPPKSKINFNNRRLAQIQVFWSSIYHR